MANRKWTEAEEIALQRYVEQGLSHAEIGDILGRTKDTVAWRCSVKGYLKVVPLEPAEQITFDSEIIPQLAPPGDPDEPIPIVPTVGSPWPIRWDRLKVPGPCTALMLMDTHMPWHDRETIELAVDKAKKLACEVIILNGDILDCGEISDHLRERDAPSYKQEIGYGRNFLCWLRQEFPKARIIYKEGNHEDRLGRYLLRRAAALSDLEGVNMRAFLKMDDFGIEWVSEKRVIELGTLNVLHGHEYRGGISTPVNPARGLYLKARSVAMCGHFHRTSEHNARNVMGKMEAAWSVGCACNLSPRYQPLNDWNLGFAFVLVESDGTFSVANKKVINGKVF